jgi:uncharacterized membrane protein
MVNQAPGHANVSASTEVLLARVLHIGTLLAAFVIACGGIAYLAQHGGETPHHANFQGEPKELRQVTGIMREAASGNARGILMLGLLLLVATPVARVAGALITFAIHRDYVYVIVSMLVLAGLLYGMLIS